MFNPVIHEVQLEDGGESATVFIREASAEEVLLAIAKTGTGTKSALDNQHENLKFLVLDKDGTPMPDEQRKGMVKMRFRAMRKLNELIADKAGLRVEPDEKNG